MADETVDAIEEGLHARNDLLSDLVCDRNRDRVGNEEVESREAGADEDWVICIVVRLRLTKLGTRKPRAESVALCVL